MTTTATFAAPPATPSAPAAAPVAAKFELKFDEQGIPIYSFPPFPEPPAGVTIMSYKDFKPRGIQMRNELDDDAIEVDGDGRPTVQLKVKHDLNKPPTKKKRKNKATVNPGEKILKRNIWHEEWAEGEELRSHFKVDQNLPQDDRMSAIAEHFKKSRTWPTGIDIRRYWDQILIFIGLQGGDIRRFTRRLDEEEALVPEEEWEEEDDEDEDDPMLPKDPEAAKQLVDEHNERHRKEMESVVRTESEEHFQKRLANAMIAKDARLESFLADPEFSMKVFFSSYFREKGMIWSEPKLRDYPILFLFFLRFVVRNKAFPELERELQKAIAAAEVAKFELPKTVKFAKVVPDELAACCAQTFGRQVRKEWEPRSDDEEGFGEERKSKKAKLDTGLDENANAEAAFKSDVEASGAFFIDHNAVEDVPITETKETASTASTAKIEEVKDDGGVASEWAAAQAANDAAHSWMDEPIPDGWGTDSPWVQPAGKSKEDSIATWKEEEHSLEALLGPTSLPKTHKVGYVEESVRSVVSWTVPDAQSAAVAPDPTVAQDPYKKFARLILSPVKSYSTAERAVIRAPELLKDPNSPKGSKLRSADPPANVPLHDPFKDNIVVLVDPRAAEHAFVGMAIGGTFVQLVSDGQEKAKTSTKNHGGGDIKNTKSKKGSGVKKPEDENSQTWWYAENVIQVLPSYWTEAKE